MNPQIWWYFSRATGVVAWLMLAASSLWGIVLATRVFPRHRRPAWLLDIHRWLGGLTVAFVGGHLAALVADSYVHFGVADLLVPFAASWKPLALAFGIVALWLLIAVEATSLAMRWLPRRVWRMVHLSSYLSFGLTSVHAWLAGSDEANLLFRASGAVVVVFFCLGAGYRLRRPTALPAASASRTRREPLAR
jgi:DMSO/TMAO reductase YedYZ heme-binding membrane subunit